MKEFLYKDFAKYYDLIYSQKDYKKEADWLRKIIDENNKAEGDLLLDLGCGTGNHIMHLKKWYKCEGIDKNKEMLAIAREKLPEITFHEHDMLDYIPGAYDIIISMFSSIAYIQTYHKLEKVMNNISNSLNAGGVVIIQPWFEPDKFAADFPLMNTFTQHGIHIARLSNSSVADGCSILDIHFLIAEKGKPVKHYADTHKMGLFSSVKTIEIMESKGISAKIIAPKNGNNRGLIIGTKQ